MCGLAGFYSPSAEDPVDWMNAIGHSMGNAIAHRGPDDSGVWVDAEAGITLSHRRLSIVDLSPEGHQPMVSTSGRFVLSYNGEVYNFKDIRRELEGLGRGFRGFSDTEVILAAIDTWGLKVAVTRFIGMFAFALWDRKERRLHLVRDQLGIKPLYYGWVKKYFVFGSELKAITALPGFDQPIDRDALALLMRHNYVPSPHSIYQGIRKLLPGCILSMGEKLVGVEPEIYKFWSVREVVETGVVAPFTGSTEEATEQLDVLLRDAVRLQMVADVPLGAFLSGGYDSSLVVALMQAQSTMPVKTFSIGFHELGYNEADYARRVAAYLGTEHTELYVTPKETQDVIPLLPTLYDEPFADSSQIPTFIVSKLAREKVTVSLSGDGGDELFSGYNRYVWGSRIWNRIKWMPVGMREILAQLMTAVPPQVWNRTFDLLTPILPKLAHVRLPGDKIHKLSEILKVSGPDELYKNLVSHWKLPESLVFGSREGLTALTDPFRQSALTDFTSRMMYTDIVSYLPDDILTKVDRASMGVGLEARVPLLDHRIVDFAWRLPQNMKVRNGESKWILRQVLYKYLPKEIMERPKMGFGVSIDTWLRGPLRGWAEELLDERRLREGGFFNEVPIRNKWQEHLSGKRNWQGHLWNVLMFQAWRECYSTARS